MLPKKRLLAGALAVATCVNLATVGAFARSDTKSTSTQTSSPEETVYVNNFGVTNRKVDFSNHWRFNLGSGSEALSYDDSAWRTVDLPHDYSIEQEYSKNNEAESGYLPGGLGWYRKAFTVPPQWQGKVITVDFGGVYMNATIYLNGKELGFHPYGYTAFSFELPQDLLNFQGENVLAVKVDHKLPSSRWYSGSGIYRSVHLTVTDPIHVAQHGTFVTTPKLDESEGKDGTVNIVTTVSNEGTERANVTVKHTVYKNGSKDAVTSVTGDTISVDADKTKDVTLTAKVETPTLWTPDNPNLYTVKTEIVKDSKVVDTYTTEFGFRWTEFNRTTGFELNGVPTKLKGVCMHHDQGPLGSEAWYRAMERQVEILKDMGVNAIRVTHNPAAPELIQIANQHGMMLVDEAFDMWVMSKNGNSNDYAKWFEKKIGEGNAIIGGNPDMTWAEFDIKAMALQDRNSPAVIMYSLGNEIFEGTANDRKNEYPDIADQLCQWLFEVDSTRPPTFGQNSNQEPIGKQIGQLIAEKYNGVSGVNYATTGRLKGWYDLGVPVYNSETASAVTSRGVYDRKNNNSDGGKGDKLLTSYDKSAVPWGATASDAWWRTLQQDWSMGEFVWTGFDYIGEPTPWNGTGSGSSGSWPAPKSSYFGIIDTNGLPKDTYWLYQSLWNDKVNTLHMLPTWNEDEVIFGSKRDVEVVVYSDAPTIKLYLNGQEVGTATSTEQRTPDGHYTYRTWTSGTGHFDKKTGHQSLYATFWVPYQEGKLEVKAFDASGKQITETQGRSIVQTTSDPSQISLTADRSSIAADGDDLSYITIDVKDDKGTIVNTDDVKVSLSIQGEGKIVGVDNGRQADHTSFQSLTRNTGAGQLVAVVQSTNKAGSFTVTATAEGLKSSSVTVNTTSVPQEGQDNPIISYNLSRFHYVKVGNAPVLPREATVTLRNGNTETKSIHWNTYDKNLIQKVGSFSVTGTLDGTDILVSVNVTMLDQIAALLNYATAVKVGSEVSLPASRPAILEDGSVLTAEFPVTWNIPADLTKAAGTKEVLGSSTVFGQEIPVKASVRVAEGTISVGANVAQSAHLSQSIPADQQSDTLSAIIDGRTAVNANNNGGPNPSAWTNYKWSQISDANKKSTITFTYDTAQNLGQLELYCFTDTFATALPKEISIEWNMGSDPNGWKTVNVSTPDPERQGNSNVYKYIFNFDPIPAVQLQIKLTNKDGSYPGKTAKHCVGVTEVKLNLADESFPISSSADFSDLTVNEQPLTPAQLAARTFDTEALIAEIKTDNGNHIAYNVLPPKDNVVKILTESEDHTARQVYTINLGVKPDLNDPTYDTLDYPFSKTQATAGSNQNGEGADRVIDGDSGTIWHTKWDQDLSNQPEKRYIQLTLDEVTRLDALRYLPRQRDRNGITTQYRVEVSATGEERSWKSVSTGTWESNTQWKIARFDEPVDAKYVRLYGVATIGDVANKFMSAAEVRVRTTRVTTDLSDATVTVEPASFEYTGKAIEPKPTVKLGETELRYGLDYGVKYENNVNPGQATLTVFGITDYAGEASTSFTVTKSTAALERKISEARNIDLSQYTEVSATALKDALAHAEAILADKSSTQEQINAALAQLEAAMLNLVEKPQEPVKPNPNPDPDQPHPPVNPDQPPVNPDNPGDCNGDANQPGGGNGDTNQPGDGNGNMKPGDNGSVQTGDTSHIFLFVVVLTGAATCLIALVLKSRKREN